MRVLMFAVAIASITCNAAAQTTRATGLLFIDRGIYDSIPPAPPPLAGRPPATVDLSQYGYFPEPGDQGNQESCVGWAVAYGLKSYQKNREFRLQNMVANFQFSPAFIYNQIKQNTCSGGSYIVDALRVLEGQGALPLDKFSYSAKECEKIPTEGQIQSAWEYRIARWMRVNVQSPVEMKAQIARGFPVILAMKVYQSFVDWRGNGVYATSIANAGEYKGGHALLVVGYADQLKAYKVFNSWGKDWGEGGYAWIDYRTFQAMAMEGYVTIDIFMQHFAPPVAVARHEPPAERARGISPKMDAPPIAVDAKGPGAGPGPFGTVRGGLVNKADSTLTADMLSKAVRSTTKPRILFQWKGLDVVPYSVWLDLNRQVADSVARVEYWFDHPSFTNPKKSEPGSDIFIANWKGYGCISTARVKAFLKKGEVIEAAFDLCEAQKRF